MFVKPSNAFVGKPSVVCSSSGRAKYARYARLLPSTRKSSQWRAGASSSSSSSPVSVFGTGSTLWSCAYSTTVTSSNTDGVNSSVCCLTRPIRSRNSGSAFQVACASKLSHGAKLMYKDASSTSRTSRNVPEPSHVLAHVTKSRHAATNSSSSPCFTRQMPLVYVSAISAPPSAVRTPAFSLVRATHAGIRLDSAVLRVPLLSGTGVVFVPLGDDDVLLRAHAPSQRLVDAGAAVRDSLRYPLSGPGIEDVVTRGAAATIVVQPPALPLPGAQLDARPGALASTLDELERCGVAPERQTILVAGGLARRPTTRELERLLPPPRARSFRGNIVVHDAEDPALVRIAD